MDCILSVVIPCYNAGDLLIEALESVIGYPKPDCYEIIIVNDGSTDAHTIEVLRELQESGILVINQINKGPGAARNTGVKQAKGRYILFLDSDNKIRHDYITKGIALLDLDEHVGVVHGKAHFFGEDTKPRFIPAEFDLYKIFSFNYIDMCAVIRKSMWVELGGFDEERVLIGHEDWDFWIRVALAGWKFHFVDEILFDYRQSATSLVQSAVIPESHRLMMQYLYGKHLLEFAKLYQQLEYKNRMYTRDKKMPLRSFLKFSYHKYFK